MRSPSSPALPARENRPSRSTRSTPRASAGSSSPCPRTRGSISRGSSAPTSTSSNTFCPRSRSSRGRRRARPGPRWEPRPKFTTSCASCSRPPEPCAVPKTARPCAGTRPRASATSSSRRAERARVSSSSRRGKSRSFEAESAEWRRLGFFRYVSASGDVLEISSSGRERGKRRANRDLPAARSAATSSAPTIRKSLSSLSMAFDSSDGEVRVLRSGEPLASARRFFRGLVCDVCGTALHGPRPRSLLVQLAAGRVRDVSGLRARHRHRPGPRHPGRNEVAPRSAGRAVQLARVRERVRRPEGRFAGAKSCAGTCRGTN